MLETQELLTDQYTLTEELRCALTTSGEPSVTLDGMTLMLQLHAEDSDSTMVFQIDSLTYVSSSWLMFLYKIAGGVAVLGGVFPPGSGPIVGSGIMCTGLEYRLSECANDTVVAGECTHSRDAGVQCTPGASENNKLVSVLCFRINIDDIHAHTLIQLSWK